MVTTFRIDKLHRVAEKAVDVVFVIRRDDGIARDGIARSAWIADEETRGEAGEGLDDLVHRALSQYRVKHPPASSVSVLIVDCSR
jgi:hypothetical protein